MKRRFRHPGERPITIVADNDGNHGELTEQIRSPHIRNVADVQRDRFRRKYLASKRLQRKVLKDTLRCEGVPDIPADKLLPRVLHRKLLEEHVKSIEAGITLAEIFRLARGFRTVRAIEAKSNARQG